LSKAQLRQQGSSFPGNTDGVITAIHTTVRAHRGRS
jgi:hypothetical protein